MPSALPIAASYSPQRRASLPLLCCRVLALLTSAAAAGCGMALWRWACTEYLPPTEGSRPSSTFAFFCEIGPVQDPLTRTHVRQLDPCSKTGQVGDRPTSFPPAGAAPALTGCSEWACRAGPASWGEGGAGVPSSLMTPRPGVGYYQGR